MLKWYAKLTVILPMIVLMGSASFTVNVSDEPPWDKKHRLSWAQTDNDNANNINIKTVKYINWMCMKHILQQNGSNYFLLVTIAC